MEAAKTAAEKLGFSTTLLPVDTNEPTAEEVAKRLLEKLLDRGKLPGPQCLISGGEPVVKLAPASERGRGGRNQQLVLSALQQLAMGTMYNDLSFCMLSGGTDGEDGPTDAAGGWITADSIRAVENREDGREWIQSALLKNDAYPVLEQLGSLLKTGPTNTNVCDLRVMLIE